MNKYLVCYKYCGFDSETNQFQNGINSMIWTCDKFNISEMNKASNKIKEFSSGGLEKLLCNVSIQILSFSKLEE